LEKGALIHVYPNLPLPYFILVTLEHAVWALLLNAQFLQGCGFMVPDPDKSG